MWCIIVMFDSGQISAEFGNHPQCKQMCREERRKHTLSKPQSLWREWRLHIIRTVRLHFFAVATLVFCVVWAVDRADILETSYFIFTYLLQVMVLKIGPSHNSLTFCGFTQFKRNNRKPWNENPMTVIVLESHTRVLVFIESMRALHSLDYLLNFVFLVWRHLWWNSKIRIFSYENVLRITFQISKRFCKTRWFYES